MRRMCHGFQWFPCASQGSAAVDRSSPLHSCWKTKPARSSTPNTHRNKKFLSWQLDRKCEKCSRRWQFRFLSKGSFHDVLDTHVWRSLVRQFIHQPYSCDQVSIPWWRQKSSAQWASLWIHRYLMFDPKPNCLWGLPVIVYKVEVISYGPMNGILGCMLKLIPSGATDPPIKHRTVLFQILGRFCADTVPRTYASFW